MRLFTLQSPFRLGKTQDAVRLLSDERFVDLKVNLGHFRDKYDAILANRDERADRLASVRGDPYRRMQRLHRQYIGKQRDELEALLNRIARLKESPVGPGID